MNGPKKHIIQKVILLMKSGKIILGISLGVILINFLAKSKTKKIINKPTSKQYKNRLEEFCLNDIDQARNEFEDFLNLGLSPSDAFELTIVRRVFI